VGRVHSKSAIISVLAALAVGTALGAWWFAPSPQNNESSKAVVPDIPTVASTFDVTQMQQELISLRKTLQEESLARRHLEETVAQLSKSTLLTPHKTYTTETERTSVASDTQRVTQRNERTQLSFDGALIAIGVTAPRVTELKQRLERMELQQIYLRNQAQREGWLGTPRYNEERRKLDDKDALVRAEVGDEAYDKYLYLSGEENRVVIQSVLSGSAAQVAGLQDGDIIYRYDQKRIFRWSDITNSTAIGRMGENVMVEVQRAGQPFTVYIPRGPLGVRLAALSEKP